MFVGLINFFSFFSFFSFCLCLYPPCSCLYPPFGSHFFQAPLGRRSLISFFAYTNGKRLPFHFFFFERGDSNTFSFIFSAPAKDILAQAFLIPPPPGHLLRCASKPPPPTPTQIFPAVTPANPRLFSRSRETFTFFPQSKPLGVCAS